jgi:pyridoxal phosphate enzyme (YggS family)
VEAAGEAEVRLTLERGIAAVRSRIDAACARAGRDPSGVTLIGVTKTHRADIVQAAYDAGLRHFGENRVQEGRAKIEALRSATPGATWHLIGHLQTNKIAAALECFDILHGIDSVRLAQAISERAGTPIDIMLEVNVAGEASKFGMRPADVAGAVEAIGAMPGLRLRGLMAVAPVVDDPEDARPVFRRLRELRDAAGLTELSMGMTDDFEVAVEEGATFVRVGRAIFGARGEQAGG